MQDDPSQARHAKKKKDQATLSRKWQSHWVRINRELVDLSPQPTNMEKKSASEASSTQKKLASTRKLLIKNSKSTQKVHERSKQFLKIILKNGINAALRATQPSIARVCEREFKAAPRGTQESMTGIHWVFVEGGKWQACSRVCLLLSGVGFSVLCTEVGNAGLCRRCRSY